MKYLIKSKIQYFDEHWMPISLRCRVCQLSYDFILHYEDLQSDWAQLLRQVNITENIRLPWENRGPQGSLKAGYLDKLPEKTLLKLFNKVAADFTMFGYTIEDQY